MLARNFGWKKDKRDERDFLHKPKIAILAEPDVFTMEQFRAEVRNQGNLGSCTGFGIGGKLTSLAKKLGVFFEWFSPTWIYNGGRFVAGDLPYDVGCYPRDNYEFIRRWGLLLEQFRPYIDILDKTDPTKWGYNDEAAKWPILSYYRVVDSVAGLTSALAQGNFVSMGTPWYASWDDIGSDGILPEDYREVAGGHETFLYGYDKIKKVFYGQNSWGKGWGNGGRFIMPFSAIERFKADGGYDAHYAVVEWALSPPPPPPPPEPVKNKLTWLLWVGLAVIIVAALILIF